MQTKLSESDLDNQTNQQVVLKNGRKLGYAEFGDRQGRPLFYFHGFPASRLEGRLIDAAAIGTGVRVIATDRPGYGLSDLQPGRRLIDFPKDIIELADVLKIDRFAVLGVSGGGPYALACGATIPTRLTAVGVVCGLGPVYESWALQAMHRPARLGFVLAQRSRFLLHLVYGGVIARIMRAWPQTILAIMKVAAPAADTEVLKRPKIETILYASFREALRQGPNGALMDLELYAHSWGFDLGNIKLPVKLWHGDEDALVPRSHIGYQIGRLPNAEVTYIPDEGHFSLPIKHMDSILNALLA